MLQFALAQENVRDNGTKPSRPAERLMYVMGRAELAQGKPEQAKYVSRQLFR